MEFQRRWVVKSKIFGQKSTHSKEKNRKIRSMNDGVSKIGHDFRNKVCISKIKARKYFFFTKNPK